MEVKNQKESTKLSRRTIVAAVLILLCIPVVVAGSILLGNKNYYVGSVLILVLAMLPFALVFESRRPKARELVTIAVLVALAVAGRAAFFMLPQVKPMIAIVIIAGVCFGGEAGFVVGSMACFVSNFIFGQGPWTPWQMFAAGIVGFLAGLLFKKGWLEKKRIPLCLYGGLATLCIYGVLMDTASLLMVSSEPTLKAWVATLIMGIPFTVTHAVATTVFLLVFAPIMIEKLDRMKKKYGMTEL